MASNPGDAGPAAASTSSAAVLTFFSPDDLRRFLDGLQPPYPQYTDTLWAFGVRSLHELAHASADTLRKAGVNNDLHIDNIKASAGAATSSGQAGTGGGAVASAGAGAGDAGGGATALVEISAGISQMVNLLSLLSEVAEGMRGLRADRKLDMSRQLRYTSSTATKCRDPTFKKRLIEAYGCQQPGDNGQGTMLRCMLLDKFYPSKIVCAAHLFKFAWADRVAEVMSFDCINDVRNGLLLLKPLEEAFDNGYLIFLESGGAFTAHWLGPDTLKITDFKEYPWGATHEKLDAGLQNILLQQLGEMTFKALEGKTLVFGEGATRPYKRCLSFQARKAVEQAMQAGRIPNPQQWMAGKNLAFNSPEASKVEDYLRSIPPEGPAPPEEDELSSYADTV